MPYTKGKYTPYWSTFPTFISYSLPLPPSHTLRPEPLPAAPYLPPSLPSFLPPTLTCPSLLASVPARLAFRTSSFSSSFFYPSFSSSLSYCSSDPTSLTMAPPVPNLTLLSTYLLLQKLKKNTAPKGDRYSCSLLKLVFCPPPPFPNPFPSVESSKRVFSFSLFFFHFSFSSTIFLSSSHSLSIPLVSLFFSLFSSLSYSVISQ